MPNVLPGRLTGLLITNQVIEALASGLRVVLLETGCGHRKLAQVLGVAASHVSVADLAGRSLQVGDSLTVMELEGLGTSLPSSAFEALPDTGENIFLIAHNLAGVEAHLATLHPWVQKMEATGAVLFGSSEDLRALGIRLN